MRWTSARDSSEVIHARSPLADLCDRLWASCPFRVIADLSVTNGRLYLIQHAKASFNRFASASHAPVSTAPPAARSCAKPRPATAGLGSAMGATTRLIFARTSASVHGPVRPVMQHGSRLTYSVAPAAFAAVCPVLFNATISAWSRHWY